jgi:hypothetical protein
MPPIAGSAEQLLVHSKMYALGDKYIVQGLQELAKQKFQLACLQFWSSSGFGGAIDNDYTSSLEDDLSLRELVIATISSHPEITNKYTVVKAIKDRSHR